MTFQQARDRHLANLDACFHRLREIVSDPTWTSSEYKEYVKAIGDTQATITLLRELNQAEMEAR